MNNQLLLTDLGYRMLPDMDITSCMDRANKNKKSEESSENNRDSQKNIVDSCVGSESDRRISTYLISRPLRT